MPHFPHTPERLLGRNDSKNPETTCKGITSSGRPCRRALATSNALRASRRKSGGVGGVVALVEENGEIQGADFYCWQHKVQAAERVEGEKNTGTGVRRMKRRSTELFPLQERSSIDTLVERLHIRTNSGPQTRNPEPPKRTDTADFAIQRPYQAPYAEDHGFVPPPKRPSKPTPRFWESLCCMSEVDDDYLEIVRHKKRAEGSSRPNVTAPRPLEPGKHLTRTTHQASRPQSAAMPARKPLANPAAPPSAQRRATSNPQTNRLLSLIPQHLSPQMTAKLLAELIKPISAADEEGYIYIFWLTPQSKEAPAESTARSLLAPEHRPQYERRISDVMTEYSFDGTESARQEKKTIMLKIGRANNVTRRMTEWQRQCGYKLNLVRWYPYVPSSATPSPQPSPRRESPANLYPELSRPPTRQRESDLVRKVPRVKRVERLIHLELAEKQVKRQCNACGKEHREWFEVDASQAGVKAVDETVRRWVGWAERHALL